MSRRRTSSPHPNARPLPPEDLELALQRAAEVIRCADALLVCTGAGMGVDCGFKTYRGRNAGVWGPLEALRLDYSQMCDPDWFESDPGLAWAYWHHCFTLYSKAEPHDGYRLLAEWGGDLPFGCFSVTTNIDGHWLRTLRQGQVLECHGSVMRLQSLDGGGCIWPVSESKELATCNVPSWDLVPGEEVEFRVASGGKWGEWSPAVVGSDGFSIESLSGDRLTAHGVRRPGGADLLRVAAASDLPLCKDGKIARPNVLMFGDFKMNSAFVDAQRSEFKAWEDALPAEARLAVIEIGAGRAIPVARDESERIVRAFPNATLVRINLDDSEIGINFQGRAVSIAGLGALEALNRIDALLKD